MSTTDLLFELGTEELPAGEIDSMVTALYEAVSYTHLTLPTNHPV